MRKRLSALTAKINIINSNGIDPEITGIAYDSRSVAPGFLFIALPGVHVDGHAFIDQAISSGAAAVLYSDKSAAVKQSLYPETAFIRIDNTRTAMAEIAAAFYDYPADKLITIGVTGTDGKTSTVYFIDQLLEMSGYKCGFISTAACKTDTLIGKNPYRQSTPEALEIDMMLQQMLEAGKSHAVIESTSHGLSPRNNRLGTISFDAAVFTNLSHEHLEFHGSLEQYRDDKANLFRKLKPSESGSFGVVNLDDTNACYFIQAAGSRVYTCSLKNPEADFYVDRIETRSSGSSFRIRVSDSVKISGERVVETEIGLPGLFNIENAVEAFAAVTLLTGKSPQQIAAFLPELAAVKGRMKVINHGQPFTAIVDYAHTPGAFLRLFPDMRAQTRGRLIAVFGSAGERDTEKRPEQGEIAARFADILILADEDPRGEAGIDIIREIASGAFSAERGSMAPLKENENLFLIPDRLQAIRKAVSIALPEDTVITLGKGHEGTIIYSSGSIPWDEQAAVEEALGIIGY